MDLPVPLQWPAFHTQANSLQRILRDVPLVGIDARARRLFVKQLKERSPDCKNLWPETLRTAERKVSPLVMEYMRWPNDRFIPDDDCFVLLWDPSWEMRIEEFTVVLEEMFQLSPSSWDDAWPNEYGGFIARLSCERV